MVHTPRYTTVTQHGSCGSSQLVVSTCTHTHIPRYVTRIWGQQNVIVLCASHIVGPSLDSVLQLIIDPNSARIGHRFVAAGRASALLTPTEETAGPLASPSRTRCSRPARCFSSVVVVLVGVTYRPDVCAYFPSPPRLVFDETLTI